MVLERFADALCADAPQMIGDCFAEAWHFGEISAPQRRIAADGPDELAHRRRSVVGNSGPETTQPGALIVRRNGKSLRAARRLKATLHEEQKGCEPKGQRLRHTTVSCDIPLDRGNDAHA